MARHRSGRKDAQELHKGDRVAWRSHGSVAVGKIRRKLAERTRAGGRTVAASPERPQYEVESDRGGTAVHKPEALHKRKGRSS